MPQNLYAQFVCPSPKVPDFNEKRLHWASVVCVTSHAEQTKKMKRLSLTSSRKSATISQIAQRTIKFIIKTMFLFLLVDNKIRKII